MAGVTRRQLLASGSLGMVAAGVATALPAAAATAAAEPDASASAHDREVAKDARLEGPLVAHVTDLHQGRISLYVDDREVRIVDHTLAARLYAASR